mmetsp:Transcript_94318/g.249336  ORF Transcript_94318/g.249336 Transcript_94318/m.249336 type:complete len:774 (+) Transcript_94318:56-2377(+)
MARVGPLLAMGWRNVAALQACLVMGVALLRPVTAASSGVNPLEKTVELMTALMGAVIADGEKEQAAYSKFADWCKGTSLEKQAKIKSATKQRSKLEATLQLAHAQHEGATVRIDELSGLISNSDERLKEATVARAKEAAVFKEVEGKLMDSLDALGRAVETLEKESQASSAALVQTTVDTQSLQEVLLGLGSVIDAVGSFTRGGNNETEGSPGGKLVALLESAEGEDNEDSDGDAAPDAPGASVTEKKSVSIIELLEDMRGKAEDELRELRKDEANAQHNYKSVQLALEDEIRNAHKEMQVEKQNKALAAETQATSQGDLDEVKNSLKRSEGALTKTQSSCMSAAAEFDQVKTLRTEELAVLAKAMRTVKMSMTEALAQTAPTALTDAVFSFLQTSSQGSGSQRLSSSQVRAGREAAGILTKVAREGQSTRFAQIAERLGRLSLSALAEGRGSEDPFAKVKSMIEAILQKLETQATAEAQERVFCEDAMSKTGSKHEDLSAEVEEISANLDKATSASQMLKAQVQELQADLAEVSKQQAELDDVRREEHAVYVDSKKDLERGLSGVRMAISTLKEYYASAEDGGEASLLQSDEGEEDLGAAMRRQPAPPQQYEKSTSAASSIIGLLETIESDTAASLAKEETQESDNMMDYNKLSRENKVLQGVKEKGIEYKTHEYKKLDKLLTELSDDYGTTSEELSAVSDYLTKVKSRCTAKPETYDERRKRRTKELEGLKEAFRVLDGSEGASAAAASFLQRRQSRGSAVSGTRWDGGAP